MRQISLKRTDLNPRPFMAYLLALSAAAALDFAICASLASYIDFQRSYQRFHIFAAGWAEVRLANALVIAAVTSMIDGVLALITAWVVTAPAYLLAQRLELTQLAYYLIIGMVAAVVFALLWGIPSIGPFFGPYDFPPYSRRVMTVLWMTTLPMSLIGAIVFWFIAGRYLIRYED